MHKKLKSKSQFIILQWINDQTNQNAPAGMTCTVFPHWLMYVGSKFQWKGVWLAWSHFWSCNCKPEGQPYQREHSSQRDIPGCLGNSAWFFPSCTADHTLSSFGHILFPFDMGTIQSHSGRYSVSLRRLSISDLIYCVFSSNISLTSKLLGSTSCCPVAT